jgi:hypothetical protein
LTQFPGLEFKPVVKEDEQSIKKKTFLQRKYYNKQAELFGFDMIEESKEKFNIFYEMRKKKN